jgi:hypothetical protein
METVNNVWEAVNTEGRVVGTWEEQGSITPEAIRRWRDEHHPGTRLRVVRHRPEVSWDGQTGETALPSVLITRNEAGSLVIEGLNAEGGTAGVSVYKDEVDWLPALRALIGKVL